VPLRFKVDGVGEWSSDDYTLDEMAAAEKRGGFMWFYMVSQAKREAECTRALVTQWLARTAPDLDAAAKQAGALTGRQIDITEVDDDDRPIQWEDGLPVVDPKADGAG
jgi:hypothetical protein